MKPYDSGFLAAIGTVLAHEGGLEDDPADPGGITNMGVSLKSYPALGADGIRNLSRDQAMDIYFRDWWNRNGWWRLPPPIGGKILDFGVNAGVDAAHRCLQRALRALAHPVDEDGRLGPLTLQAVSAVDPQDLLPPLRSEMAAHYRIIAALHPAQGKFLEGWLSNRAYS